MTAVRRLSIAAVAVVMACASGQAAPEVSAAGGAPSRNVDVITEAELADPAVASGDAYDAVQKLRPRFLMTRGAVSARAGGGATRLSIDGGPLLALDGLRSMRPSQLTEIRYLSASDATQRFGAASASGSVILVKLR